MKLIQSLMHTLKVSENKQVNDSNGPLCRTASSTRPRSRIFNNVNVDDFFVHFFRQKSKQFSLVFPNITEEKNNKN